jgi:hypothetical protein
VSLKARVIGNEQASCGWISYPSKKILDAIDTDFHVKCESFRVDLLMQA